LHKEKEKDLNLKEEKEKGDIFRKLSILGKLYNITVYTYSLASYIREFNSLAGRRILLNNCIR